jgi:hypothetical protein
MRSRTITVGLFTGLTVLTLAPACAKGDRGTTKPLRAASGEAYTNDEIVSLAETLAEELEMPDAPRDQVLSKLRRVLDEPDYRKDVYDRLAERGVTGVIAFRLGEDGAVSTEKNGRARVRLKGQAGSREFGLAGEDLGAELAPSREWGIGLVLGLPEGDSVDGEYAGPTQAGATGSGSGTVTLKPRRGSHQIVLLGSGAGVSLDVNGASLELEESK